MTTQTVLSAGPTGVAKRTCPVVLAALASFAVAYGFGAHPSLLQLGGSFPLSDIAPGLAQAFSQLGNLPLPSLTRHGPATHGLG
jgi:hypothetical protein